MNYNSFLYVIVFIYWSLFFQLTLTCTLTLRHMGRDAFRCVFSPCDLEDPQQADAAQHRDPQRRHDPQLHQDGLHDAAAHHKAVESIEECHEVMGQTQTVHLQQHLHSEQRQQHLVGNVCREKRLCFMCSYNLSNFSVRVRVIIGFI